MPKLSTAKKPAKPAKPKTEPKPNAESESASNGTPLAVEPSAESVEAPANESPTKDGAPTGKKGKKAAPRPIKYPYLINRVYASPSRQSDVDWKDPAWDSSCNFKPGLKAEPLSAAEAKKLLEWEEESENVKFTNWHTCKDRAGKLIRCLAVNKQRQFDAELAELWMCEILGNPYAKLHADTHLPGNWALNGANIRIGQTGIVIDGQHRLVGLAWAAEEWHKDPTRFPAWKCEPYLETIVTLGIQEIMYVINTQDTGKPRDFADAIVACGMYGEFTKKQQSDLARMTDYCIKILWDRMQLKEDAFAPHRTHAEGMNFLDRHRGKKGHWIEDCIKHIYEENGVSKQNNKPKIGGYISAGTAAGLMWLMGTSATERENDKGDGYSQLGHLAGHKQLDYSLWDTAADFWVQVAKHGENLAPLYHLLTTPFLVLDEEDGASVRTKEKVALFILAWKAFAQGAAITEEALDLQYNLSFVSGEKRVVYRSEADPQDMTWKEGLESYGLAETPTIGGVDLGPK